MAPPIPDSSKVSEGFGSPVTDGLMVLEMTKVITDRLNESQAQPFRLKNFNLQQAQP